MAATNWLWKASVMQNTSRRSVCRTAPKMVVRDSFGWPCSARKKLGLMMSRFEGKGGERKLGYCQSCFWRRASSKVRRLRARLTKTSAHWIKQTWSAQSQRRVAGLLRGVLNYKRSGLWLGVELLEFASKRGLFMAKWAIQKGGRMSVDNYKNNNAHNPSATINNGERRGLSKRALNSNHSGKKPRNDMTAFWQVCFPLSPQTNGHFLLNGQFKPNLWSFLGTN